MRGTRPIVTWNVHPDVTPFIREQFDGFMKGYHRDYLQAQRNHVELMFEKNTLTSIIEPVAMEYTLPFTVGRGYASLSPRYDLAERFKKSGKNRLLLLIVTDFDPDGEEIAASFARSLQSDFGILPIQVHAIKVALTKEQIDTMLLPQGGKAKKTSTNYGKFVSQYGDTVYELEALPRKQLQNMLRDTIESVIDMELFNKEKEQERADRLSLRTYKNKVLPKGGGSAWI